MMLAPDNKPDGSPPLRIPPHNLHAEQALLGAILIDNNAFDRVSDILTRDHFFDPLHANIFETLNTVISSGRLATPMTLKSYYDNAEPIDDKTTVPQYLGRLVRAAASTHSAREYGRTIIELAQRRALIVIGEGIAESAFDATADRAAAGIIEDAEQDLFRLGESGSVESRGDVSFAVAAREAALAAQEACRRRGAVGLSTGLRDLDAKLGGLCRTDLIILAGRPSMGKAQPLDANVLTHRGWTSMGSLKVGDALASIDGKPSTVTGVFPQGKRQVYRVEFNDGRAMECCDEHLWSVNYKGWQNPRVISTNEVRTLLAKPHMKKRLYIETFNGQFGLPYAGLDPWLIGVIIGDGCVKRSKLMVTSSDDEIIEGVRQAVGAGIEVRSNSNYDYVLTKPMRNSCSFCGKEFTQSSRKRKFCDNKCSCASHYYTRRRGNSLYDHCTKRPGAERNWLIDCLREMGLWDVSAADKRIPDNLLKASRVDRLALLRGLLDTDGTVETWGTIRFCTVSNILSRQVVDLVRSLGGIAKAYPKHQKNGEHKTAWVINITGIKADPQELFSIKRKASRLKEFERKQRLSFSDITPTRVAEVQCISVSHLSHLYITDDYIVTHNTALAVNIAWSVARNGNPDVHGEMRPAPVGFFSLEMSAKQLANRVLSSVAEVSAEKIRYGTATDDELERIVRTSQDVADSPLYIDDRAGITIAQLMSRARKMRRQYGIELLVVDYLQLMAGKGRRGENRVQEVTEITTGLKAIAKELNIPVLALSQLSRNVENRDEKKPQLSDLRESGSIEQDADIVLFVFREEYYLERTKPSDVTSPEFSEWQRKMGAAAGKAEVIIGKQRHGPVGTVELAFEGGKTRFSDLAREVVTG